jgi:hypothetical protein
MPTQSTNNTTEATSPTGDIKVFIDAFNKDFDTQLKSLLDAQQNYKNVYADAIKISTPKKGRWPLGGTPLVDSNTGAVDTSQLGSDPKVVTIGDLFKYTFPDINSDKIVKPDKSSKEYGSWAKDLKASEDEKIKTMYDTISNGISSNKKIENYQSLKKPGITNPSLWSPGQYYFDVFMSKMLSPYGPLKDPSGGNGGESAFGGNIIEGGGWLNGWLKANGGSASVSNFNADGIGATGSFGYINFYEIIEGGYVDQGVKYRMINSTGIDIDLDYSDTKPPKSFPSLFTQYRTGPLSEFISVENSKINRKDPTFQIHEGIILNPSDKEIEISDVKALTDLTGYKFVGYYEHMLLYKAFIQAGDNYKPVVLPLRNPEPPTPAPEVATKPVVSLPQEVGYTFNVEKKDSFVIVGGGSMSGIEFTIVPNDGTTYIISTPDLYDELPDEEYMEDEFVGTEQEIIEIQAQYAFESDLDGLNYRPVSRYSTISSNGTAVTNTPHTSKKSGAGTWQKAVASLPDSATFKSRVEKFATEYNTTADQFYRVMYAESRILPDAYNKDGGASGLIQFMPSTAKGLGTTTDYIRSLSATQQMDWVEKYFRKAGLRKGATVYDMYALVFFPIIVGKSDDWIIQTKKLSAELVSKSNPAIARAAGKTRGTPLNVSDFKRYVDSIS